MFSFFKSLYLQLPSNVRRTLEDLWSRPITPISTIGLALYMVSSVLFNDTPPEVTENTFTATTGQAMVGQTIVGHPYVTDGDTIIINNIRIRFHGIDAFEKNQSCNLNGDRDFDCGAMSKDALVSYIDGNEVSCLVTDIDTRYNRAIAICSTDAINDMNALMVHNGMALAYEHFSTDYVGQQRAAEEAKAGAWSGYFMQPWNVR